MNGIFFIAVFINDLQSRNTNLILAFKCTIVGSVFNALYSGMNKLLPICIPIAAYRSLPRIF